MRYLTIKEKKILALANKDIPLCVSKSYRNHFIVKLRGVIFNGSLKNKNIKI